MKGMWWDRNLIQRSSGLMRTERYILIVRIPHLRMADELGEVASYQLRHGFSGFSVLPTLPHWDFALTLSSMGNQLFTFHTLPFYCLKHTQIFPIWTTVFFFIMVPPHDQPAFLLLITFQFNKGNLYSLHFHPSPTLVSWRHYDFYPIIPEKLFSCATITRILISTFNSLCLVWFCLNSSLFTHYGNSLSFKTLHWFSSHKTQNKIPQLNTRHK